MIGALIFANPGRKRRGRKEQGMAKKATRRRVKRRKSTKAPSRRRKATGKVYRRRRKARRNYVPAAGSKNNPPRKRRRPRRKARRNTAAVAANPRKRTRRRRRKARRNPSGKVYRRRYHLMNNPLAALTDTLKEAFSGETLETVFHTGLGFGGTLVASRLIYKQLITGLGDSAVGRVGTTAVAGVLTSALLGTIGGKGMGVRALMGGLLATLWAGVSEAVKDTAAADWIPTLGEGESEEFRKAIEQEVLRELKGGGVSHAEGDGQGKEEYDEEGMSYYLSPAGAQEYQAPAGSEAYLTSQEAEAAEDAPHGMEAYLTSREVVATEAGVGESDAEFGPAGMPERF